MSHNMKEGTIITYTQGLISHYCVYVGSGSMMHNLKFAGLRESGVPAGYDIYYEPKTIEEGKEIADRARSQMKKEAGKDNYHLIGYNCEHFAKYCMGLEPDSTQADFGAQVVLAGVGAAVSGAAIAAGATTSMVTVPAAGLLGALGFTTTVASTAVAAPLVAGLACGAAAGAVAYRAIKNATRPRDDDDDDEVQEPSTKRAKK